MQALALVVQYDGTNYAGWQIQPGVDTIQQRIQTAVREISGLDLNIVGAGRTDAGVHARGQVAHAVLNEPFPIPSEKIIVAVNSHLPEDIRVIQGTILDFKFNARKDAIAREYSYSISNRYDVFQRNYIHYVKYPFDPEILNKAAEIFIGKHDFTTFSKMNTETKNYVCKVELCEWESLRYSLFVNSYPDKKKPIEKSLENFYESPSLKPSITNKVLRITNNEQRITKNENWVLHIRADRFVYGMVRSLVGAMLDAARGKRTIEDLKNALDKRDRKLASPFAPPNGLVLEKVYYPDFLKIFDISF